MERTFIIAITLAVVLGIGINASEITINKALSDSCGCDNNICRGVANNTAIPNEAGCEHFFICIDERPIPNTCPHPQWFNPEVSQCDNSTNPCDSFQCPPDGIHFFPHDEYCYKFIMCFAGFPIISRCAEGLYWDRELETCNFPEYSECKLDVCPPENDPKELIFLPSDKKCDKYYICYEGSPWELWCAPGLHWHRELEQCDFPENVNCTIEQPDGPSAPQPHEIDCDSEEGIYFVSHPNSCQHYFICARGESVLLECAPDFWWDNNHNWCDAPENTECTSDPEKLNPPQSHRPGFVSLPALVSRPESPLKPDSSSRPDVPVPYISVDPWVIKKSKQ